MSERFTIDGSAGEGGGQVLRTALALSLATGRPFRIDRIRARREKPGLMRQHLTAVQAAVAVSDGRAIGADLGSSALEFEPARVRGGDYRLAVGTAGSATLVLQALLPALLLAPGPTRLSIEGGTHNPMAPPFDFLALTLVPLLQQMGARIQVTLAAHGFYPAGGGRVVVEIEPCNGLTPLCLLERGEATLSARALVASLPEVIAKRELAVVNKRLGIDWTRCRVESIRDSAGPGNLVMVEARSATVTEVATGFGVRGVSAEAVAGEVCDEVSAYVAARVPVGRHLADQLLVPLALAGGGVFRTVSPMLHTTTTAAVIEAVLGIPIGIEAERAEAWRVTVGRS